MKCYYHPNKDAVSICSQCGKAACHDCIEDVEGAMLCKNCIALAAQIAVKERKIAIKRAKRSITWSWIVTVMFGLFLVPMFGQLAEEGQAGWGILLSIFSIYAVWSTYWGWKVVWPWWREFLSRIGCFLIANPLTWILLIALFFYIPFIGAYIYGCLGGGVYQYLKYQRIARGQV